MTDPARLPSILLRTYAMLVRAMLWVVLLAWLLFTLVWGGLHGWIVPRIEDFRPRIEREASSLLGVTVRIGSITAQTVGLVPWFELHQVTLLDRQGRPALTLPLVSVALSPTSLLNRGFDQLYIERPDLDVRRTAQGKILVAGLDVSGPATGDQQISEWFFSQAEVVIRGGTVRWTDEKRGVEPLELSNVDFLSRNSARRHDLRLDATPPSGWGSRFTVVGKFREPLVALNKRVWEDWEGWVYSDFPLVQVAQLRRYADIGVEIHEGTGAMRLWSQWSKGLPGEVVADLALGQVSATLGQGLQPLALRMVSGRLAANRIPDGLMIATRDLSFQTDDGLLWPPANLSLKYREPVGQEASGELHADRLEIASLASIARHLPLDAPTREALARHDPKGVLDKLQFNWRGPHSAPSRFDLRGGVRGLQLAALPQPVIQGVDPQVGTPGVRGLNIEFEANQADGNAQLSMQGGALILPGVFEDPNLTFDQFAAELRWRVEGDKISVQFPKLSFANADGQGQAKGSWHTGTQGQGRADRRFPGVLDLQAQLDRVEGKRVYRYLPLVVVKDARDYVREAVLGGQGSAVQMRVKGDLYDMPFETAKQGEFHIAAQVRDATLAYIPESFLADPSDRWPSLTQLAGELVFDRMNIRINGVSGRLSGKPGLRMAEANAVISDLAKNPVVTVQAEVRGPLAEMLTVVAQTPVAGFTGHVLDQASGTGEALTKLKLVLPINALPNSRVEGSVVLVGNDVQVSPDTPLLQRASGTVNFTETSLSLSNVQARMYGGDLRLEGGGRALVSAGATPTELTVVLRAQGTAQAESLRRASELGFVPQLARFASGTAAYSGVLTLGRGLPEISLSSNLKGVSLNLPPPFRKDADSSMPLRFENALVRGVGQAPRPGAGERERVAIDVDGLASLHYVRERNDGVSKVLSGAITLGLPGVEAPRMPERGVSANAKLERVDVDAWQAVFGQLIDTSARSDAGAAQRQGAQQIALELSDAAEYLPTSWALQARELTMGGRRLHDVVFGGSRLGQTWRANVDARELGGYGEFRQSGADGAGQVFARLARLNIAATDLAGVDTLLVQTPQSIPALDIVVDAFELRGRKLGRLEIEAVNRGGDGPAVEGPREWRLGKLNITIPEASFSATGNWAAVGAQAPAGPRSPRSTAQPPRTQRTVMNFKLDVADSGALLARFGMKDVVRGGKGRLEGQVAWLGSPLQMDYPSLGGRFGIGIDAGQFLKADPGIAKLLGVLSLQSLPRRLALDFRDVFSEGFAFDFVRGDVQVEQGVASTNNLQMKGVNAAVLLEGRADIAKETQDLRVVVAPEIDAGTLSLVATVINPAIGIGSFLAQLFLRRPLIQASTQEFKIDGTWADPKVTRVGRGAAPSGAATTESR